ncbi:MAG: ribosome silencing factor [Verrucomicrobiae bacterium]|nr:ribosome silencing factor [Verrucomicrobiae bacterium]MCX7915936.1 ribosome silencing factor [Verrucomicrobiae bacterium]MDW8344667.1 ribosome silencing factor [Verrucomicrobiae bacterium]
MNRKSQNAALALAKRCRDLVLSKKAEDVTILDLRAVSTVADYFVIASGTSEPHLKALANTVETEVRSQLGLLGRQAGDAASRWIVLDYGDVLVHLFHPELRARYSLEHLWGDAKRVR